MLGDLAVLTGGGRPRLGHDSLPAHLVEQSTGLLADGLAVDVAWPLSTALRTAADHTGSSLQHYRGVVIAVPSVDLARIEQDLVRLVTTGERPGEARPPVVVLFASADPDQASGRTAGAFALAREMVRDLGLETRLAMVPARTDAGGALSRPELLATSILRGLRQRPGPAPHQAMDQISEVAIDRTLALLLGRTSHLRRALILAQNSFETPFAQLNLVSRGTLRSLAYIGRSSEGLQESLSAETFRGGQPLLVSDTRAADRFMRIPETHGPDAIRYYVGHPVHDDSGNRVGVLCVLDVEPHPISPGDEELIRDVALLAEGELSMALRSTT